MGMEISGNARESQALLLHYNQTLSVESQQEYLLESCSPDLLVSNHRCIPLFRLIPFRPHFDMNLTTKSGKLQHTKVASLSISINLLCICKPKISQLHSCSNVFLYTKYGYPVLAAYSTKQYYFAMIFVQLPLHYFVIFPCIRKFSHKIDVPCIKSVHIRKHFFEIIRNTVDYFGSLAFFPLLLQNRITYIQYR